MVLTLVVRVTGNRTPALTPDLTEAQARLRAQTAFDGVVVRRAALCEAVGLIGLALGVVTLSDGGFVVIVTGIAVSVVMVGVLAWPGERTVQQVAAQLERQGVPSGLREGLGLTPDVPGRTTL